MFRGFYIYIALNFIKHALIINTVRMPCLSKVHSDSIHLIRITKKMNITLYYTLQKKMNDTLKKGNNALRKTMQE